MVNDLFLPSDDWGKPLKEALRGPGVIAALTSGGIIVGSLALVATPLLIPSILLLPLLQMPIWYWLVSMYLKKQLFKKIDAILNSFPGKYTRETLETLSIENPKELNRLYKLASDEFFRKFVQEQANHKKAQELIVLLQQRIEIMKDRCKELEKKAKTYDKRISALEEEIQLFEEILSKWKKAA